MSIDPTDPETFENEGAAIDEELVERDEETPDADAAEQHAEWRRGQDDPLSGIDPASANAADAAEQARVVELDEDDYR
ncbi:hypothetical protein [Streptomyces sp. GC420]|uniref:hypothetical protein n=1 Tax=Streptomyces sp. GC420 TaxID=2697568 RepID=UPI001414F26D|nr:hypothetical protein [Streptomyces sp. GC420]NBM16820.1 hypothetical protein [Streptomyces sp. GC420]